MSSERGVTRPASAPVEGSRDSRSSHGTSADPLISEGETKCVHDIGEYGCSKCQPEASEEIPSSPDPGQPWQQLDLRERQGPDIPGRNEWRRCANALQAENADLRSQVQRLTRQSEVDEEVAQISVARMEAAETRAEAAEAALQQRSWQPEVERVIKEMRTIAMVAGQCSIEGPEDGKALMAAAESERCSRWADELSALIADPPRQE